MIDSISLPAFSCAKGTINLPGSKSISNRVLLLSALANGVTIIENLLVSDDTQYMLLALKKLGVMVEKTDSCYKVTGCCGQFPVKNTELYLGNSGTAFRPLAAVLSILGGNYILSGVERMYQRPIGDLVAALRLLGAKICYKKADGYPPLRIESAQLEKKNEIMVRGDVSSQFLTALLMALPLTGQQTVVHVTGELISKPYIDITINLMSRFGVDVIQEGWHKFIIPANANFQSVDRIIVEGDASSASYFMAAGLLGKGPVTVCGLGKQSIQGDIRFADEMQKLGAQVVLRENEVQISGMQDNHNPIPAFDIDANHIPDAAMTLAVMALVANGPCVIRNIASWRVKETDRIEAMATELRKLGARVVTGEDFIHIIPTKHLQSGVAIDTYDDHRMAMCFSLVSLMGVSVTINNPDCVSKTYPKYFDIFSSLGYLS